MHEQLVQRQAGLVEFAVIHMYTVQWPTVQHAFSGDIWLQLCQVNQFLSGDSNRVKFLGETEFWAMADLQQLALGPTSRTIQCLNEVVEDALSLASTLAPC